MEQLLSVLEVVVKVSIELVVTSDHEMAARELYGSCCIVSYKGKRFVLTAAHVTRDGDSGIEKGYPHIITKSSEESFTSDWFRIGHMNYVDEFYGRVLGVAEKRTDQVDVAYAEIPQDCIVQHPEVAVSTASVPSGLALDIILESSSEPSPQSEHFFFGRVGYSDTPMGWSRATRFQRGLRYVSKSGPHHLLFNTDSPIDVDLAGCSGSPVLDKQGTFVGIVTTTMGTNAIFVLSASTIRLFLDHHLRST